jgi:lysozyme family protein
MSPDFKKAMKLLLDPNVEGGYSNDPHDPGGETNHGVSDARDGKKDGKADLNGDGDGDVLIKDLTPEQAEAIYYVDYWQPAQCDKLPWPLSYFVFDFAVNQYGGPKAAVQVLQKALNTVQDGVIGNNTLAAIRRADQKYLCTLYLALRARRYVGTRNFDRYGTGWFRRLFTIAMEA